MNFAHPWILLFLLALPLLVWVVSRRQHRSGIVYGEIALLPKERGFRAMLEWLPRACWLSAAALIIVALARPQLRNVRQEMSAPGIDIVLALDMSTSMLSDDFRPNRFAVAKDVLKRFIDTRTTDRVALVVFAGRAYTQVPLTFDYRAVKEMIDALAVGQIEDGTAIGMGLVEAINRLRTSEAKSRVVILLTDGVNNRGRIDPETAGRIAKVKGVKIYTIGMGLQEGDTTRRLFDQMLGVRNPPSMNPALLQHIAMETGGQYFEAAEPSALNQVYDTIAKLERSEVTLNEFVSVRELYPIFLHATLLVLSMGMLLDATWLRRVP